MMLASHALALVLCPVSAPAPSGIVLQRECAIRAL